MKVKDFKFKDIQKISILVTKLDLQKEDIKEITDVLTGAKSQMLITEEEVNAYLIENVSAKERKELFKDHDGDFEALRAYALEHKGVDPTVGLFEVIIRLLGILAVKFDVIADFMAYYLEDYEVKDIMEFDEDQSADAIMAVFTNAGFLKFFSRLFNTK